MDERTKARIAAEESHRFLANFQPYDADGLNNVDLSGTPSFQPVVSDKFEPSDKDGLNNVDVSGMPTTNRLKAFIASPDDESLQRVGQETRNPDILAEVTDKRETREAEIFLRATPDYVKDDDNFDLMVEWISAHGLEWTAANLSKAFRSLVKSGQMEALGGNHNLRESEKLHCLSIAKSGRLDEAISTYLGYAIPNADEKYIDADEFLSDPNTLDLRNQAVEFCWFHARPAVTDTPDWHRFKKTFFRGKPAITVPDLDAAWSAFEKQGTAIQRERLIYGQPDIPPTVAELDQLDDAGVDSLYHKTLRHYARTAKSSAGILV